MTEIIKRTLGVINISGKDARDFLQSLITLDIAECDDGGMRYGLLLSAQGKFLYDFFIVKTGDIYKIITHNEFAAPLSKKLSFYRLRKDVGIERSGEEVFAVSADGAELHTDPRSPALPYMYIGEATHFKDASISNDESPYHRARIEAEIPEGVHDMQSGESFPMHFGMDKIGAISFDKGCYIGQEVTARSKHLGKRRKYVRKIRRNEAGHFPAKGQKVNIDGESAIMLSSQGDVGLALFDGTINI